MERKSDVVLRACLLVLILWPALATAQPEAPWEKIADEHGILIEARPMPGTALREIRAQTHSPVSPEIIFEVIWNVGAQHEFLPNLTTVRVVRQSDDEVVVYERVKIPVAQDRDYVLRLTKKVDAQAHVYDVYAQGASELGPAPEKGVVRMTKLWSTFSMRPGKDGGTDLTYTSFGDPAGTLPSWIIRAADVRGPRDFVRAILQRAEGNAKKK